MSAVTSIFTHLDEHPQIKDIRRLGKKVPIKTRPRTLLITLVNPWDVRKVLAKGPLLKSYRPHTLFMNRGLTLEESETEQAILKKRRELISSGVKPEKLKIRNLQLLLNGKEINVNDPPPSGTDC